MGVNPRTDNDAKNENPDGVTQLIDFCAAPLGLDLRCTHFCGGSHHRLCYAARSGLLKRIIVFVAKHKITPLVIARSGYTTIMDLHQIGRRAILFPTKGQWEQEYLAKRYRG